MRLTSTVRNVLIVLVLAAIVDVAPGGGKAASVVSQAVYLAFLAALAWFASIMYRQHRYDLDSLGERRRTIVYAAVGVAVVVLTATHKMWLTSGGSVAWLVLMAAAIYAVVAVVVSVRRG